MPEGQRALISKNIVRLAIVAPIIIFGYLIFRHFHSSGDKIPTHITKQASFPIYYPTSLPTGYIFEKKSAKFQKNILFFSFSKNQQKISVSEQAVPKNPPDLNVLKKFNSNFKNLDVLAGKAIYGTYQNQPISILLTNTTLINVAGSGHTPLDSVARITQAMSSQ